MTRGLMIAAPRSGSGKTTVTLGLLRAFKRRGVDVVGLKSGPDYIDPAFHAAASGREGVNLNSWAMAPELLAALAARAAAQSALALCEASMGLFDGVPAETWAHRRLGRRGGGARHAGPAGHRRLGSGAIGRGDRQGLRILRCAAQGRRRDRQSRRQRASSPARRRGDRGDGRVRRRRAAAQRQDHAARAPSGPGAGGRDGGARSASRGDRRFHRGACRLRPRSRTGRRTRPRCVRRRRPLPFGRRDSASRSRATRRSRSSIRISCKAGGRPGPRSSPSRRSPTSRRLPIATSAGFRAAIRNCTPGGWRRRRGFARAQRVSPRRARCTANVGAIWRWAKALSTPRASLIAMAGLLGVETSFEKRRMTLGYREARIASNCALGAAGARPARPRVPLCDHRRERRRRPLRLCSRRLRRAGSAVRLAKGPGHGLVLPCHRRGVRLSPSSACASAISGISGVGEKPSSAGARMACASSGRPVDW